MSGCYRYKPVAMINMLKPLANDYSQLFARCFDKEKNAKFFEHLNVGALHFSSRVKHPF